MTLIDIQETYEFELQLAQLLLKKEPWEHIPQTKCCLTRAQRSQALTTGEVRISESYLQHRNFQELRTEIRGLLADLHCGFRPRHNFAWQRIAIQLGIIKKATADDACNCELCGQLTKLTRSRRCVRCKNVEQAIVENLDIAKLIMENLKCESLD